MSWDRFLFCFVKLWVWPEIAIYLSTIFCHLKDLIKLILTNLITLCSGKNNFSDLSGRRTLLDGRPAAFVPLHGAVFRILLPRGRRHQSLHVQDQEDREIVWESTSGTKSMIFYTEELQSLRKYSTLYRTFYTEGLLLLLLPSWIRS